MATKIINNLKQKPENYRKMLSLVVAFSITAVIAVVWVSVLRTNMMFNQEASVANVSGSVSPLDSIINSVERLSDNVSSEIVESWESINTTTYIQDSE